MKKTSNFLGLLLSLVVTAVAFKILLSNGIALGGVTGVAQILNVEFSIAYAVTNTMINLPLFLCIWKTQSPRAMIKKIVTMMAFSSLLDVLPTIPVPVHSELIKFVILLVTAIMADSAIGALERWFEGSTGGFDVAAEILSRSNQHLRRGDITAAINSAVLILSILLVGGIEKIIPSILLTVILNRSVNLTASVENPKQFIVMMRKRMRIHHHTDSLTAVEGENLTVV